MSGTLNAVYQSYQSGERNFRYIKVSDSVIYRAAFVGCDFTGAELDRCQINATSFTQCRFHNSSLLGLQVSASVFEQTNFTLARLGGARIASVTLDRCDLSATTLVAAHLQQVLVNNCTLRETVLDRAYLDRVTFEGTSAYGVSLSASVFSATNLDSFCESRGFAPKTIPIVDWRSICRSIRHRRLEQFLLRIGTPEIFVRYMADCARAIDPDMLFRNMRSTFISYGSPDQIFASSLNEVLRQNGVETFLFMEHAVPGQKLHHAMREGINKFDRMILICSEASLMRNGVRNEIEECLAREARDGGASYLIPVTLDDFLFTWTDSLAHAIRDRVVADFREWQEDESFGVGVQRLLTALKHDEIAPDVA